MLTHNRFFSLDREIAQIEFNKSIAGCYRDGNAEYDSVGVLFLTWKEDDMNCKEREVNALEQVFKDKFYFKTEQYEIPPTDSEQLLFNRLQAFIRCYDKPSKLGIIYYGGHAQRTETPDGVDLELFARRLPHGSIHRTNTSLSDISIPESPADTKGQTDIHISMERPEQPHIIFGDVCDQIKSSETDMLLIVDSCYAAGAFTDQPFGGRKCELLCSIAEKDFARAPGHEGSFTKILTTTLEKMIEETPEGFTTWDLYRRVYRQQHQAHKPFHFTQSRFDFGRIWLRPCEPKERSAMPSDDSKYTIDVRFHLTKSLDLAELNKVVKTLQWIPYVQMVKMQHMRSPSDNLSDFIRTVHLTNRLRPVLARVRRRLELKRAKRLCQTGSSPPSATSESFHIYEPRDVGLFDWSKAQAVTYDKPLTSDEYIRRRKRKHDDSFPTETNPAHSTMADAALQLLDQEEQSAVSTKFSSIFECSTNMRPSQRTLDGLLFFAMGILAPKVIGWVMQGSAAP